VPVLGFLGFQFSSQVEARDRQTDGRTDRYASHFIMLLLWGRGHKHNNESGIPTRSPRNDHFLLLGLRPFCLSLLLPIWSSAAHIILNPPCTIHTMNGVVVTYIDTAVELTQSQKLNTAVTAPMSKHLARYRRCTKTTVALSVYTRGSAVTPLAICYALMLSAITVCIKCRALYTVTH